MVSQQKIPLAEICLKFKIRDSLDLIRNSHIRGKAEHDSPLYYDRLKVALYLFKPGFNRAVQLERIVAKN